MRKRNIQQFIHCLFFILFFLTNLSAQLPYADIHVHTSIKPFNSRHKTDYNHWDVIEHNCSQHYSNFFVNKSTVPRRSQSDFETMIKGNTRIAFLSLTPLERRMMRPRLLNVTKKGVGTYSCVTGINYTSEFLNRVNYDYFTELADNLQFVIDSEHQPYSIDGVDYTYEIIQNAAHLSSIIKDKTKIGLILSIEGGHALGNSYYMENDLTELPENRRDVLNNVDRIKGVLSLKEGSKEVLEYPVMSINLAHFYWNGLCGQARTFTGREEIVFGKQKNNDVGFSPLGMDVMRRLLDRSEGRRVLIDVRHMSLQSRQEYYQYLDDLMVVRDTVPVIFGHCAVSNLSWAHEDYAGQKDNLKKNKEYYLNNWTINPAKEDIQFIHKTGGLVGLMLDKNRITGTKGKKAIEATVPGSQERRETLIDLIMANILSGVQAIGEASAWDIFCLGSDFDGMITPVDNYQTVGNYPDLARDMTAFLNEPRPIFDLFSVEEIKGLMFDYTAEEIVSKIMSENVLNFLTENLDELYSTELEQSSRF